MPKAMQQASRLVSSRQIRPHRNLCRTLSRRLGRAYLQPVRDYNLLTFNRIEAILDCGINKTIILDAGCGTGESTLALATLYPDHWVIGIDKSAHRLARHQLQDNITRQANCIIARADLVDLWRLALRNGWKVERHYLLFPNPWPKTRHFTRRWHGHPVFPALVALGGVLELRTNWPVYAEEFAAAITRVTGIRGDLHTYLPASPLSPFERKYQQSGHVLTRYQVDLVMGGPVISPEAGSRQPPGRLIETTFTTKPESPMLSENHEKFISH